MSNKNKAKPAAPTTGKELTKPKPGGWGDEVLAGMSDEHRTEALSRRKRIMAFPSRPSVSLTKDGKRDVKLGTTADNAALNSIRVFDALGSGSNQFVDDALRRVIGCLRLSGADADAAVIGGALALVASVNPQNEMEATMAIQMVAANEAALMFFERARTAQYMEHASPYSNMANKAMRSFALHAEALAKLRRGGEQVVKHVHVSDGGQAVIAGTFNNRGGG